MIFTRFGLISLVPLGIISFDFVTIYARFRCIRWISVYFVTIYARFRLISFDFVLISFDFVLISFDFV